MISKSKNKMQKKPVKKKDAIALGIKQEAEIVQCPGCHRMVLSARIVTCPKCGKSRCDRCGGHTGFTICECLKGNKNA
jgi:hypothetical protein